MRPGYELLAEPLQWTWIANWGSRQSVSRNLSNLVRLSRDNPLDSLWNCIGIPSKPDSVYVWARDLCSQENLDCLEDAPGSQSQCISDTVDRVNPKKKAPGTWPLCCMWFEKLQGLRMSGNTWVRGYPEPFQIWGRHAKKTPQPSASSRKEHAAQMSVVPST